MKRKVVMKVKMQETDKQNLFTIDVVKLIRIKILLSKHNVVQARTAVRTYCRWFK